ncbi:MbtH family protein [Streptomyces olivaceoviridis]|uniref:MbtH family protein n=1 Tax=Streptomyces olivaceoviridis TaxID=1921 RepID=UPI0036F7076E
MSNPFDDPDGRFLALRNADGQYSLWPAQVEVPSGWDIDHGEADRQSCLDHIEKRWTVLRPVTFGHSPS